MGPGQRQNEPESLESQIQERERGPGVLFPPSVKFDQRDWFPQVEGGHLIVSEPF